VTKGFRWLEEVNRVTYDPGRVTVPQMEGWLRRSGTYLRTVPPLAETERRDRTSSKMEVRP